MIPEMFTQRLVCEEVTGRNLGNRRKVHLGAHGDRRDRHSVGCYLAS